ncbi:MAG: GAF domain-containing protein, partial [Chloroflexi bacterium]|nr:GAF domain-containing protein [Chloroflexota bacterium]
MVDVSAEEPAVSETLAGRALAESRGFIWRRQKEGDISRSVKQYHIETGMYAPLRWHDKSLGVICVDTPEMGADFAEDDLRLLMAVAQYAGVAVANHQLQDNLRQNSKLLERLLTNFSPKIREVLLERARRGRLKPGGDKSQVTILFCDIRNFTSRTVAMETGEVVDLLNDYFAALV